MHFGFQLKILPVLWVLGASMMCTLRRVCGRSAEDPSQAIFLGSKWSVVQMRSVMRDAIGEVLKVYPHLKLQVYVDDLNILGKTKRSCRQCRRWRASSKVLSKKQS